ncbi:MAG TPA: hypothetical protein EYP14_10465, partial [Planctomycetaceae bacterium]|nr:hypothetical protein [Planctomycetaceae bacterium]
MWPATWSGGPWLQPSANQRSVRAPPPVPATWKPSFGGFRSCSPVDEPIGWRRSSSVSCSATCWSGCNWLPRCLKASRFAERLRRFINCRLWSRRRYSARAPETSRHEQTPAGDRCCGVAERRSPCREKSKGFGLNMTRSELEHIALLTELDTLTSRLTEWAKEPSAWTPIRRCQTLMERVLQRVETVRVRWAAPLIVATFGGTGTGKSALINALLGRECTPTGRQRPTTRQPILIVHTETDLDSL